MLISDRDPSGRTCRGISLVVVALCGAVLAATGCSTTDRPMQIQFYSPPGAAVAVRNELPNQQRIPPVGPFDDRLERWPDEACVFDLAPGTYEFKYTSADGLPGISVYGELVVCQPETNDGLTFQRRSFVPIALPSEYYKRVEVEGNEIFPYRGEAFRTAIEAMDLELLKQGGVIEKVFFVANLEKAEQALADTKVELAVCEREIQRAEARFRDAYLDFHAGESGPWWASMFGRGRDTRFVRREADLQRLQQKLDGLLALRIRLEALLAADHILMRNGMLVLATPEIVESHRDVVEAASDLGEVVLVMRIGGQHMRWGDPGSQVASSEE